MGKRIVVGVDGSDSSFQALDVAGALAENWDCDLELLHVVPERAIPLGLRQWAGSQDEEDHEALYAQTIAENVLETAENRIGKLGMTPITKRIEHGDPASEIITTAQDKDVKALVLGTRGLTSFKGMVMGSVAQKVSHNAKCTVITVK